MLGPAPAHKPDGSQRSRAPQTGSLRSSEHRSPPPRRRCRSRLVSFEGRVLRLEELSAKHPRTRWQHGSQSRSRAPGARPRGVEAPWLTDRATLEARARGRQIPQAPPYARADRWRLSAGPSSPRGPGGPFGCLSDLPPAHEGRGLGLVGLGRDRRPARDLLRVPVRVTALWPGSQGGTLP